MDDHEFMTLFLRAEHDLRAFVVSVVGDWARADDIVQEVALVLWRKFAEYDRARPFGAWARGVASLQILKDRERARRGVATLSPEAVAAVVAAADAVVDEPSSGRLAAMSRCLASLTAPARQLIELRYGEDLPVDDVARRTGRSAAAVAKALVRLRHDLGRCVDGRLRAERA